MVFCLLFLEGTAVVGGTVGEEVVVSMSTMYLDLVFLIEWGG